MVGTTIASELLVARCRDAIVKAEEKVEACRKAHEDYKVWRVTREQELFDEIKEQHVGLKAIEEWKEAVALLRTEELRLDKAVTDAKNKLDTAQKALKAARQAYLQAVQGRRKIDEHKKRWTEEAAIEEAAAAEREMEDFQKRKQAMEAQS